MKQLHITFLLTMFIIMVGTKTFAYDFEVDGIYYSIVSIEYLTCEISPYENKHSNYSGDFVIPSQVEYNGKKLSVTRIGNYAFYYDSFDEGNKLLSVKIPNSVTSIGLNAFVRAGITNILIPNSVKELEFGAFQVCHGLTSIEIPNEVTNVGSSAFYNCIYLKTIILPSHITSIESKTFWGCKSLESLIVPDGVTSIETSAFEGCTALKTVTLPNSLVEIGSSAFSGCSELTAITLPEGLEKIDEKAFYNCTVLTSVNIPSTCTEIRNYAFNGCNLKELILDDSESTLRLGFSYVQYFGQGNFFDFDDLFSGFKLDTLYLGRLVERCDSWAYYNNPTPRYNEGCGIFGNKVKKIVIGDLITDQDIKSGVMWTLLHDCVNDYRLNRDYIKIGTSYYNHITFGKGLKTIPDMSYIEQIDGIVMRNSIPPIAEGFSNKTYINCKLVVPFGSKETYMSSNIWKNFWNISEEYPNTAKIETSMKEVNIVAWYTIDGQRITGPQKGINIIKLSDGKIKKIHINR